MSTRKALSKGPSRHAILGPSAADKWITCPPSARFEEQIVEEESVFAREGTLAHDLAALILSSRAGIFKGNQAKFNEMLGDIRADVLAFYWNQDTTDTIDAEAEFNAMLDHAEGLAAFVCDQIEFDGEVQIEREFDISQYVPLGFGTSDAIVKRPRVLHVNDYKFGAGKRVNAYKNKQGMLYALGALKTAILEDPDYKPETVIVSIYQPRVVGGVTSYEISVTDLFEWAEFTVMPAANLAIAGQGAFKAGPHCQFCKAQTICKARFDIFGKVKKIHDARAMTPKDLEAVLTYGPLIASWVKKVQDDAARKLQAGQTIKGFKLVAGGGRRTFTSEDDVVDVAMGANLDMDKLFRTELISLTDIEKQVGKKRFQELFGAIIFEKEFQPKVVDEDDPAPALGRTAHDDYEDDVI